MDSLDRGNYIVSYDQGRRGTQFQVVSLPDNSPFLFDRKRIKCSANYHDVVAAKIIAEQEFREHNGHKGLDDLEALFAILSSHGFIKEMRVIGQKRKSIYSVFEDNIKRQKSEPIQEKRRYYYS